MIHQDTLHTALVEFVSFNHAGTALVSGGRDAQVYLRQYRHGWQGQQLQALFTEPVKKMHLTWGVWTADDLRIVASLENKALDQNNVFLVVWDAVTCQRLRKIQAHQFSMTGLFAHPLFPHIVISGAMDGRVLVWDIESGTKLRECVVEHAAAGAETYFVDILALVLSAHGDRLYTVDAWGGLTSFGLGAPEQRVPTSQFLQLEAASILQ